MELLFITNEPTVASAAVEAGVARVMVDLEIEGKRERQRTLNAHLSTHARSDVRVMRDALPDSTLLVRCNPYSASSATEVERILDDGADILMLPMFRTVDEIEAFVELVRGRAKIVALVETPDALARLRQVLFGRSPPDEVYLGLNDLSLLMGVQFLMEPLAGGLVDHFCVEARAGGLPYGFGGVGIVGSGDVPAELILSEHVRLGSSRVILSRAFREAVRGADGQGTRLDRLQEEIGRVLQTVAALRACSADELEANRRQLVEAVGRAVRARSGRPLPAQ